MKKTKTFKILYALLLCVMMLFLPTEIKANDYYTNPFIFFRDCEDPYHVEYADHSIYYATRAKTATSSGKKYSTIAWRITLVGYVNGTEYSIPVDVKRNGAYLTDVAGDYIASDNYCYNLYKINYGELCRRASENNPTVWNYIEKSSMITIKMDAILSWKDAGETQTAGRVIQENSNGTLVYNDRSKVWYMGEEDDREKAISVFNTEFNGYFDLEKLLSNKPLKVYYYAAESPTVSVKAGNGYSIESGTQLIYKGDTKYWEIKRFELDRLKNPVDEFGLKRTGYKISEEKEWVTKDKTTTVSCNKEYIGSELNLALPSATTSLTYEVYANWVPINFYIKYHGNGMTGSAPYTTATYDKDATIIENPFPSQTDTFIGWNTKKDGTGTWYQPGQIVKNLCDEEGEVITLYAQWNPKTFVIKVEGNEDGTSVFYEKYGYGFASDEECNNMISSLTVPSERPGYTYDGIYLSKTSKATQIASPEGKLMVECDFFTENRTVYAHWEPNEYAIYFHYEPGTNGTTQTTVTYLDELPNNLTAPYRKGYSFAGYYTEENGGGEQYFNEYMNTAKIYTETTDLHLYAKWIDDELPKGYIIVSEDWSNDANGIPIKAIAEDDGKGLDKVYLYREEDTGDVLVESSENLNGAKEVELNVTHTQEGIFRYRLEVWDMEKESTTSLLFTLAINK